MALDFGNPSNLFPESKKENLGFGAESKENIYSINCTQFIPRNPDVDNVTITGSNCRADTNGIFFYASVSLPHEAVISSAVVYGNAAASAETWIFRKVSHTGSVSDRATGNINTEAIMTNATTIDNKNFTYLIFTSSLDTNDIIYGAKITYTL